VPALAERRQMSAAGDEGEIGAGGRKVSAEESADAAASASGQLAFVGGGLAGPLRR